MRAYLSLFRIRFIAGLQYRAAALGGLVTQFFWGFMFILMYRAFYQTDAAAFPMTFQQTVNYTWLQQAFILLLFLSLDGDIFADITSGSIAYELARPIALYAMWYVRCLAKRLAGALLRCMPVLIVAAVLPAPFGLSLPASPAAFGLFVGTMVTSTLLMMAYTMLVYCAAFYTINPSGVRMLAISVTEFLSGGLIPIPFMPEAVQRVLSYTPFAYMQNLPLRIYGGSIDVAGIGQPIAVQLFWLAALVGLGALWMSRALRKVVVQGG